MAARKEKKCNMSSSENFVIRIPNLDFPFFLQLLLKRDFLASGSWHDGHTHFIDRATLFDSVLALYSDYSGRVAMEFPFRVQFKGEKASDLGRVARDFFSGFFEEAYIKLFDGNNLLYPAVNGSVNMRSFEVLGSIISHGFLVSGVFPDRLSFPSLAAVLMGPKISITESNHLLNL